MADAVNGKYLLGKPDTSLSGRSTRKALKALTSMPSFINNVNTVLIILQKKIHSSSQQSDEYLSPRDQNQLSPYDHDQEIQQVPSVTQISSLMHHKTIRYDFHHTLRGEYHQKYVLDFFLNIKQFFFFTCFLFNCIFYFFLH